jgi:hypothetical protein
MRRQWAADEVPLTGSGTPEPGRGRVDPEVGERWAVGECSTRRVLGAGPSGERFSSEHGPVLAFCGEDLGVLGVGIAPTAVVADGRGQLGVALVVGVGDGELPERSEMGLD